VRQRVILTLADRLAAVGIATKAVALTGSARPSPGYRVELDTLRAARDEIRASQPGPLALVGRSFGGRMCAFLAATEPPDALVIVGHPISPPGRPRPRDEEALASIRCPTLVVQGDRDELGPVAVVKRVASGNPLVDVVVIAGAKHELTPSQEREAADHAARWLDATLG
jgi:predicted alpha/beta-hydrolase family hydrolase